MLIKTIIIEDEEKSVYILNEFINRFSANMEICGTAGRLNEAVELIEANNPHLVFMDVRIVDGTGFDVLRQLSHRNFELIFVTAYDSYALEAFRFAAIDYLLKPISSQEFEEAVEKVRQRLNEKHRIDKIETLLHNLNQQQGQHKKISIPTLNGYDFIELQSILWCKSDGPCTQFYLTDKSRILSSRNLGFYEELLANNQFCRIHHGIIINMQWIKSYIKGKGGYVVMKDGTELEISQRRKSDFLEKFSI